MEMLAEFLLLGWDGNTIQQQQQREGWKVATSTNFPFLGNLDTKQEI